mgnify:CR=1 FL=1
MILIADSGSTKTDWEWHIYFLLREDVDIFRNCVYA